MKRKEHIWRDNVEGRVCNTCHEWKPLDQFYSCAQTWDKKER